MISETFAKEKPVVSITTVAVVLVCFGVGIIAGHGMPELKYSLNRQIAADNFVTATLYGLLLAIYIRNWNRVNSDTGLGRKIRNTGNMITYGSWGLHRLFWGVWREYLDDANYSVANWMRDDLAWVTSVLQLGVWIGAILVLMCFAIMHYGRAGIWIAGLMLPTIWLTWFLLVGLV